jgi:sugar/nucleoside kinase (ribokinase family)
MKVIPKIVVAGHVCLDLTPQFLIDAPTDVSRLLEPGKLLNMGKMTISTGGPVSNTGIALAKLGMRPALMAKIGNDYIGKGVLEQFAKYPVTSYVREVDDTATSYTVALVPKGMDRIFLHCTGANDTFDSRDLDYGIIGKTDLFHFGYPPLMQRMYEDSGKELIEIFKRVKELGVTTSLDMSLPDPSSESGKVDWQYILEKVLPYVDLFLPSIEESSFMIDKALYRSLRESATTTDMLENLDINDIPRISERFIAMGAKVVAIKCGVKGFSIRTAHKNTLSHMGRCKPADLDNWSDRELHEESFNAEPIVSATGSGDSSIAGFLSAFHRGYSIEESIRIACAVGGLNVQAYDAISGIKSWEETLDLIDAGWAKNKLHIEGNHWTYDDIRTTWVGINDSKPPILPKHARGE